MPNRPLIDGPAGPLELQIDAPQVGAGDAPAGIAVVCHPHPQQGGTLDNKVAYTLARAAQATGHVAYRFNFRGVGNSAGTFGDGAGEQDDARAVAAHAQAEHPGLPLILLGFSFGGWVALTLADELDAQQLITVAPPMWYFGSDPIAQPACPWTLIHGEADEVVDAAQSREALAALDRPPQQIWVPEVGHFFHGALTDLRQTVTQALQTRPAD